MAQFSFACLTTTPCPLKAGNVERGFFKYFFLVSRPWPSLEPPYRQQGPSRSRCRAR